MLLYKPFIDEARAIVDALPAVGAKALSKRLAKPLHRRCLAWLDTAPISNKNVLRYAWGDVVGALVHCEDVLRSGVSSLARPQASQELVQWLDWVSMQPSQQWFVLGQGRRMLYASVCRCAAIVDDARPYSPTLHDALVVHRWSPTLLLEQLGRCRDAHRTYRQQVATALPAWPEDAWVAGLLSVAQHTAWTIPKNAHLHGFWMGLALLEGRLEHPQQELEALVQKLVHALPASAGDAQLFVQRHPELVSPKSLDTIAAMDMAQTSPLMGIFAWIRMHTHPHAQAQGLQTVLRERYQAMDETVRAYVQVVTPEHVVQHVQSLLAPWQTLVLGLPCKQEDTIEGDLFA